MSETGTGADPLTAQGHPERSRGATFQQARSPRAESRGDRDLAARVLAGDREAFEGLYRQHAHRLYNLAFRMTGGADADDLLQDVFLQAYRKLGSYKGDSSLGTWLYRLTMNLCLDHLRSKQGKMGQVTDSLDEEDAAPVVSPFRPAEANNARLDLEQAIAQLPPSYRIGVRAPRRRRLPARRDRAGSWASRREVRSRCCIRPAFASGTCFDESLGYGEAGPLRLRDILG